VQIDREKHEQNNYRYRDKHKHIQIISYPDKLRSRGAQAMERLVRACGILGGGEGGKGIADPQMSQT
jgi:hypothetical protein